MFCTKSRSKKDQIFDKWDIFEYRLSCKGYSPCKISFLYALRILIFDPKWHFYKGCSFCKVVNFGNAGKLVFWILGLFFHSFFFLHRSALIYLWTSFSHVFENFNIWPKVANIAFACIVAKYGNVAKLVIFNLFLFFWELFFAQRRFNVCLDYVFSCFWEF